MNKELLDKLSAITEEEQRILDGRAEIEKKLYASGEEFTIDYAKLLKAGQLITVRPHTRFAYFPMHRHNYVEVMYVCEGEISHVINDKKITVHKGEILFLNQFTRHEILPAGEGDIAINFVILPEFFDVATEMIGKNNVLADFLVNALRQDELRGEYLYFKVADRLEIQNLVENMIYSLVQTSGLAGDDENNNQENAIPAEINKINQTTMGLILLYLLDFVPSAKTLVPDRYENLIVMTTLNYIEQSYRTATLGELCQQLHLPDHTLSRMIKKSAGGNFKDLLQRKRLSKAVSLLCDTDLPINDIIDSVGYENHSYFHRIFKERYHATPKDFRKTHRQDREIRL